MHDDLKAKLERYLPIRVVVKVKDGQVHGLVEHSFSMDWDPKRVNIFWSGKAYSILGEHDLDGISWAQKNAEEHKDEYVFDPLAEDSPIEVDWEKWLAATDKFSKRNAPFTTKPQGAWQLRALTAERKLKIAEAHRDSYAESYREEAELNNKIRDILNPPQPDEEDVE